MISESPTIVPEVSSDFDEENRLRPEFVESVRSLVAEGDAVAVREKVGALHPADIADLLELLSAETRRELGSLLGDIISPDVFAEMNEFVREDMVENLEPEQVAAIASELDSDDAVALIEDLGAGEQQAVLEAMEPTDRAAIEDSLDYPEETAARLMQRDLVAFPEHVTIGDVIDKLRDDDQLTTEFWEVFVVDPAHHPIGTCQLSWILRTARDVRLADIMQREQTLIPIDMDQEEVALKFQKYALISAAVVDSDGRLVGMITVDDIVHIIQQEADEDILRLSGAGEGDINEPIAHSYRKRAQWLIANLGTAVVGSAIIYMFGSVIERMVVLAALMPVVASIGGNAGTQTMAVAVRALATNQLTRANSWRIVGYEFKLALLNGVTIALLLGLSVALLFGDVRLGIVIGLAIQCNIVVAGLSGVAIPIALERIGQDPAVASSVFVTMITDSMGFLLFLGLAVLGGLVTI